MSADFLSDYGMTDAGCANTLAWLPGATAHGGRLSQVTTDDERPHPWGQKPWGCRTALTGTSSCVHLSSLVALKTLNDTPHQRHTPLGSASEARGELNYELRVRFRPARLAHSDTHTHGLPCPPTACTGKLFQQRTHAVQNGGGCGSSG